jgi:hypothetical protein
MDDAELEKLSKPGGNIIAQARKLASFDIERFGPNRRCSGGLDQSRSYAHLLLGTANCTFEDIPNTQLAANLPNVCGASFVTKGGTVCDHRATKQRQPVHQVAGDSISEIFLLRVTAKVLKR